MMPEYDKIVAVKHRPSKIISQRVIDRWERYCWYVTKKVGLRFWKWK
jgi:hypothetical protein